MFNFPHLSLINRRTSIQSRLSVECISVTTAVLHFTLRRAMCLMWEEVHVNPLDTVVYPVLLFIWIREQFKAQV